MVKDSLYMYIYVQSIYATDRLCMSAQDSLRKGIIMNENEVEEEEITTLLEDKVEESVPLQIIRPPSTGKSKNKLLLAVSICLILTFGYLNRYTGYLNISISLTDRQVSTPSQIYGGNSKCLSFDEELRNIIQGSSRIFITMPAKAAGTTMKRFAEKCNHDKIDKIDKEKLNNIFNNEKKIRKFLTKPHEISKIIVSHAYSDQALLRLIPYITKETPLIYIYRNEQDRLMSAIRMVTATGICELHQHNVKVLRNDNDRCDIDEDTLIDSVIGPKLGEINKGAPEIMTCTFYDAMKNHGPNIIFVNFKQVNRLQEIIAEYNCPEIAPMQRNTAGEHMPTYVKLHDDGVDSSIWGGRNENDKEEYMDLEDWMRDKKDVIEWALEMGKSQCQIHTKHLEDNLLACPDEMIQLSF